MGETYESSSESCCVRRDRRRNAMWNIFEGVEEAVLQNLAGLSLDMVQELVMDSTDDSFTQYLSQLPTTTTPQSQSSASSCSSASSHEGSWCCDRARIQRSFSTTAGEEIQAALQSRGRRRNAVGNLFDLLTPSQKLLLVEHLQEQVGRLQGLCGDVSADNSSHVILSLSDLSSASSSSGSSSSNGSSPRSQGEIVCR